MRQLGCGGAKPDCPSRGFSYASRIAPIMVDSPKIVPRIAFCAPVLFLAACYVGPLPLGDDGGGASEYSVPDIPDVCDGFLAQDVSSPDVAISGADCNEQAIRAAVEAGGIVRVECPDAPVVFTEQMSVTRDTVLDGAGVTVLDGGGSTRLLHKVSGPTLHLQNITLQNAQAPEALGNPEVTQANWYNWAGGAVLADCSAQEEVVGALYGKNLTCRDNATGSHTRDPNTNQILDTGMGGCVFSFTCRFHCDECEFDGNRATNGGAVGSLGGKTLLTHSACVQNKALYDSSTNDNQGKGGCYYQDGTETAPGEDETNYDHMCGNYFAGNESDQHGGAVSMFWRQGTNTSFAFLRNACEGNWVNDAGGCLFVYVDPDTRIDWAPDEDGQKLRDFLELQKAGIGPDEELRIFTGPDSEVDRDSWAWISHNGTDDEVLAWMDAHNLARLARAPGEGLEQCAWRMKDRAFHDRCLALLTRRHVYDRVLWSYSLVHRDAANIEQLLLHEEYFLDRCGESLRSPLVHIDAELRGRYEHLEYAPLVNARAHRLGARHEILNDRFSEQYTRLLEVLRQKPALTPVDQLAVAGYLLLQDRFEEGLGMLDRIDPATVDTRLQLDYLRVYAHFLREQPEQARVIAEGYRDYPVDRWRHRFAEALAQLDELSGQAPEVSDPEDREQQQTTLAAAEPDLELQVEQGTVTVTYRNLTAATLRFYRMDVELLFSRQPFVQQQSEQFSFVRPNLEQPVALPSDAMQWSAPLPEALTGANVIVEVVAGSLRRSTAYFAHALSVQLSPRYGQLRVTQRSDQTPLPRTYVKVYARMQGGAVKFYKDGYTDLRGRFDYASLSTDDLDSVERFSLLVLSREHGALVREASPPPR